MKEAKPTKPSDLCTNSLVRLPKTAHKFGSEFFFFISRKEVPSLKDNLGDAQFLNLFLY